MTTHPGAHPPPPKKSGILKYVLGGLAVVILLLGCAGGSFYLYTLKIAERRQNRVETERGTEVSANGLALKFQDGDVDQVLVVSGQIHTIDGKTVNLVGFLFTDVSCEFSEANKGQVANLRINSDVKIKGVCTGKPFVNVILKECQLVD